MAKKNEVTVEDKLRALFDLQLIDSRVDEIRTVRGELPLEVEDLENEIAGLEKRLENFNQEVSDFDFQTKEQKNSIEVAKEEFKKYEENLKNVRNNREYNSIVKEQEFQELEIKLSEKKIAQYKEAIESKTVVSNELKDKIKDRNSHLKRLLAEKNQDTDDVWISILNNRGSVQHLDFLTDHEKDVFKTAIEIDQRWLIDLAADRTEMIDQAQSLNVFVPADSNKKYIHDIHYSAWKKGVKSLYYCRSQSIQRAETGSSDEAQNKEEKKETVQIKEDTKKTKTLDEMVAESGNNDDDYDECLSCQ